MVFRKRATATGVCDLAVESLLPAVPLLLQAVICVHSELMAVPVTVNDNEPARQVSSRSVTSRYRDLGTSRDHLSAREYRS
jgi:hypothetical protein